MGGGIRGYLTVILLLVCLIGAGCSFFSRGGFFKPEKANGDEKLLKELMSDMRPAQGNAESHYLLGCYYEQSGRLEEAKKEFAKTIEIEPGNAAAFNAIGVILDEQGEYVKAREFYSAAIKLSPNLDYAYNNMGYSFLLDGKYEDAIDNFKKAIDLNKDNPRFHSNLALAYAEIGLYESALKEFRVSEGNAIASFNMAQIYNLKGLPEMAEKYYLESAKDLLLTEDLKEVEGEKILSASTLSSNTGYEDMIRIIPSPEKTAPAVARAPQEQKSVVRDIGIEISNGNGVTRMAKKLGAYLRLKGFKVSRLTNAPDFNLAKTKIYYRNGYESTASKLSGAIPGTQRLQERHNFDRDQIRIKLVIGKDLIRYSRQLEKDRG